MARIKHYNATTQKWEYSDISSAVKGETGATGATGATPNLTIGTVTTLAAGTNATATITGSAENPKLNLGLPRGADGEADGAVMYATSQSLTEAQKTQARNNIGAINASGTIANATNIYSSASTAKAYVLGTTTASSDNHATVYNASVYTSGSVLYGAAWNDYAEYRETIEVIEPGRVVCENNDDTLNLSQERLQPGAEIVSDTFGFAIGETEQCKTPVAAAGRVLAYPYEDRNTYNAGDPVCAGPNGTVSKMTREEVKEYPDRMIGTVSAVPTYETWGENNVPVNGRIWIRIK